MMIELFAQNGLSAEVFRSGFIVVICWMLAVALDAIAISSVLLDCVHTLAV